MQYFQELCSLYWYAFKPYIIVSAILLVLNIGVTYQRYLEKRRTHKV